MYANYLEDCFSLFRYDVPSRPRTSSYSSRSNLAGNQVNTSSIQSPGGATSGSVTPRGAAGSRSSRSRFLGDYYDQGIEYSSDRHFRNYDEYSQGSAASHDEVVYEHEYTFAHDSPTHLDVLETRSMQSIVVDPVSLIFQQSLFIIGSYSEEMTITCVYFLS